MSTITLQLITYDNFDTIIKMSDTLTPYQKRCVAPNLYSIAEAYLNLDNAWPRAIYLDDQPIGFIMIDLNPEHIPKDENAYYLWRFMISEPHQNKGYGKAALNLIIDKCRKDQKSVLYTSCAMEGDLPYQFYLNYGFVDTGVLDGDEEVLTLKIK
ncbi:MAG: GNAT family N-acetyltransferase [Acholeplasmataceae bacterium]